MILVILVLLMQDHTEMSDDIDINVFTVISRLLSQNGFEFFLYKIS